MHNTIASPSPLATATLPRVDGKRLWQSLMELARIGATDKGGVCRLALTDLDRQGRDLVVGWARELGCTVRVDAIGNIFMRRAGRRADLPPVVTGSHIDTQPTGGKFDGNYGVLAGLEVLRTLNDHGIVTEAPVEVAVWTNEEGSRFVPVMMGSGVYCGAFTLEDVLEQRDRDGVSVGQALRAIGYDGSEPAVASPGAVAAYFEAHIEQGPVLEANDTVIGVVEGALGQRWYDVTVTGMEAHAGPTPMALRRDALLAASHVVQLVNRIALDHAPHGRGTVGCLDVHPNSRNVIPGSVKLTVDLRAADDTTLSSMDQALRRGCAELAKGVSIEVTQVVYFPPQPFDAGLRAGLHEDAKALGLGAMDIVSGAGHDAVYLARIAPTAMIFVPCKDGISHNEIEDARPEHLEAGCNLLLHAVVRAAGIAAEETAA